MKYTWSNACYQLDQPCGQKSLTQAPQCAETQFWFWIVAAGLGLIALTGGR